MDKQSRSKRERKGVDDQRDDSTLEMGYPGEQHHLGAAYVDQAPMGMVYDGMLTPGSDYRAIEGSHHQFPSISQTSYGQMEQFSTAGGFALRHQDISTERTIDEEMRPEYNMLSMVADGTASQQPYSETHNEHYSGMTDPTIAAQPWNAHIQEHSSPSMAGDGTTTGQWVDVQPWCSVCGDVWDQNHAGCILTDGVTSLIINSGASDHSTKCNASSEPGRSSPEEEDEDRNNKPRAKDVILTPAEFTRGSGRGGRSSKRRARPAQPHIVTDNYGQDQPHMSGVPDMAYQGDHQALLTSFGGTGFEDDPRYTYPSEYPPEIDEPLLDRLQLPGDISTPGNADDMNGEVPQY